MYLEERGKVRGKKIKSKDDVALLSDVSRVNLDNELRALLLHGKKIAAIKLIRQETNMGLKDAKDYVERL